MDVKYPYRGNYFAIFMHMKTCCVPKTNTKICRYISIKNVLGFLGVHKILAN